MSTESRAATDVAIFADTLDPTAAEQVAAIARHPAVGGPIAIMPDAHAGAGCVIGFTGRFRDAVIPNIVGVDIGCGVAAIPLAGVETIDFAALDRHIRRSVPLGMTRHRDSGFFARAPLPDGFKDEAQQLCDGAEEDFYRHGGIGNHPPPLLQLGTLGGGNHFIEIGCSLKDGRHLLIVHSGSRNFGKRIAEYFQGEAAALAAKRRDPPSRGLEALPLDAGGRRYLDWAATAQRYARLNRRFILAAILQFFDLPLREDQVVESVHNYISERDRLIRKGAISAHRGEAVIIPFNMADGTVLGIGKGNPDYNFSAPHGAGRLCSRKEMLRRLDRGDLSLRDFKASMTGIFSTSVGRATFDESKFAYKDPAEIERYLDATVTITDRLRPVYNLKAAGE